MNAPNIPLNHMQPQGRYEQGAQITIVLLKTSSFSLTFAISKLKSFLINTTTIRTPPKIIAEIGCNRKGDMNIAKEIIFHLTPKRLTR